MASETAAMIELRLELERARRDVEMARMEAEDVRGRAEAARIAADAARTSAERDLLTQMYVALVALDRLRHEVYSVIEHPHLNHRNIIDASHVLFRAINRMDPHTRVDDVLDDVLDDDMGLDDDSAAESTRVGSDDEGHSSAE